MAKQLKNISTTTDSCRCCPNFVLYGVDPKGISFTCRELGGIKPQKLIPDTEDVLRFIIDECPLKDAREQGVTVGISVFLVNDEGQILVGERLDGSWGLPGGGLDAGETPKEGGARETDEETSIEILEEDMEFATFTNDIFLEEKNEHWITLYFICRKWKGEAKRVEPHKCKEWRWVDIDNIPRPVFCDWAKNIDELKKMISLHKCKYKFVDGDITRCNNHRKADFTYECVKCGFENQKKG